MRTRFAIAGLLAIMAASSAVPSYAIDEEPVVLGTDAVGDNPIDPEAQAAWDQAGLDITELAVHRPDFTKDELVFIIRVNELGAAPPPEVVRYLWRFAVNGKEHWISVKTSDLTTATAVIGDPQGTVEHAAAGSSTRLRTNCGTVGVVASCEHVLWLATVYDAEANEIRVTVPIGNPKAPEFAQGGLVEPGLGAEAGLQVVVSNNSTADQMTQEDSYTIP